MKRKILAFIYDGKKFLILRNNPEDPTHGGDFWFTVTGGIENGETEEDAVKREVKEETGLDTIKIIDLNWKSIYTWDNQNILEKNFIVFTKHKKIVLNEEHIDYKWLEINKFIKEINWNADKEELKKELKKIKKFNF